MKLLARRLFQLSIVFVMWFVVWATFFGPRPFDAEDWAATGSSSARYRMARWLVAFDSLEGLSHSQVVEKLGPPLPADEFPNKPVAYQLDQQQHGLMGLKWPWLVVHISPNDTVERAEIIWVRD